MDNMLENLTLRRKALEARIRSFSPVPPAALKISVEGQDLEFKIDSSTGLVSSPLPAGAWGWVRGFRWLDLKDYLTKVLHYQVEELRPAVLVQ